ncbi:hypothetical protein GCM10025794_21500 [Massilia kyonggiensis]
MIQMIHRSNRTRDEKAKEAKAIDSHPDFEQMAKVWGLGRDNNPSRTVGNSGE